MQEETSEEHRKNQQKINPKGKQQRNNNSTK